MPLWDVSDGGGRGAEEVVPSDPGADSAAQTASGSAGMTATNTEIEETQGGDGDGLFVPASKSQLNDAFGWLSADDRRKSNLGSEIGLVRASKRDITTDHSLRWSWAESHMGNAGL